MDATLQPYRHPDLGFTIDLPEGLDVDDRMPGVALVAAERADAVPPGAFRANLTIVAEDVAADTDLEAYTLGSLTEQEHVLEGFRLLDREETELSGHPAIRTLAHHRQGDVLAVAAEQWRLVAGTRAWILTATSGALGYAATADVLQQCVASFRLEERG